MNDFTNSQQMAEELPLAENLEFEGLAPSYARTLIIENALGWLVPYVVFTAISLFKGANFWLFEQWWFYGIYVAIMGVTVAMAPMVANSRGFALRDHDIHYRSGLVWQKTISLPYNRIQHVEIESNPLQRLFKLTTLKVFTAGGGKSDMTIPALTFQRSTSLRAFIVEKAGFSENQIND